MSGRCRGSRATAACSIISGPQYLGCNLFPEAKKNSGPWTLELSVDKVYIPGCEWDHLWAPLGKFPGYSDYLPMKSKLHQPGCLTDITCSYCDLLSKVQGISSCTNENFPSLVQTWNPSPLLDIICLRAEQSLESLLCLQSRLNLLCTRAEPQLLAGALWACLCNAMDQPFLGVFSVNQCTVIHSSVLIDKDFSFLILHCIHNTQQYDKYIYQSAPSIRKKTLARFQNAWASLFVDINRWSSVSGRSNLS